MRVALPYTPGMDAAGVVRSCAPGAGFRPGQRVAVLVPYGCWQEVISVPGERVLPLPDGMSFEAGAAAPLNYLTGLFALVTGGRGRRRVETLLVPRRGGGVGTAAVQLGKALGLRTIAVRRGRGEAGVRAAVRCGPRGAQPRPDRATADPATAACRGARTWWESGAVDIVLDPVGSDRMTDSLAVARPRRAAARARVRRRRDPVVMKVNRLLLGNTGVLGVASREEFFERHPALVAELWGQLLELRQTGALADPPVEGIRSPMPAGRCGRFLTGEPWARSC